MSRARRSERSTGEAPEPLTPAGFHILLALADRERHGYAIMQEAERLSGGRMHLGPGTLYRTIGELLKKGWIEESDERPDPELDDERRRYYRLSPSGRQRVRLESERLNELVRAAASKHLLSPKWREA